MGRRHLKSVDLDSNSDCNLSLNRNSKYDINCNWNRTRIAYSLSHRE